MSAETSSPDAVPQTSTSPSTPKTAAPSAERYYADDEKLTFDEAEILVEQYFRRDVERSVTRVKHVLTESGKPYSNHNQHRVMAVLKRRCEKHNPERSGPTRFKIPERHR